MKTSTSQFEMLVNYMEQYGDINKPSKHARGRIEAIQNWEKLTELLNADPTGEPKQTEKWKKVWSDLKNNTKKKAAKINRAAGGTGGGPALLTKLSDLEQRVLNIMGHQAATGLLGVVEAGFSQEQDAGVNEVDTDRTMTLPPTSPPQVPDLESPSIFSFPQENVEVIVCDDVWNQPGTSRQAHVIPPPPPEIQPPHQEDVPTPPPAAQHPAPRGQTPRRRRGLSSRRVLMSPRRRNIRRQSHVEQAAHQFLSSDQEWRNLHQRQEGERLEVEKEKNRLKERELETQKRWQDITVLAISALEIFLDKL